MAEGKEAVEKWEITLGGNEGNSGEMEERMDARKIMKEWVTVHLERMRSQTAFCASVLFQACVLEMIVKDEFWFGPEILNKSDLSL